MEERGMNARIRKLRWESLETLPRIDMERAKYFTETYRQYEGTVSIPELRALALKNYLKENHRDWRGRADCGRKGLRSPGVSHFSGSVLSYGGRFKGDE